MRPFLALLAAALPVLAPAAHAETAYSPSSTDTAHSAALSTYTTPQTDELSSLLASPEVKLGTIRTTPSVSVSEQMGQQLERDIGRTLRQRHAHAQFCADQAGLGVGSTDFVVQLRVDESGERTVSSNDHPQFAACLSHLAQHWPLPKRAHDSRTRVAYRAVTPRADP